MAADFNIKRGDTTPPIESELQDNDGQPVDLTGASVRFLMKPRGGPTLTVDGAADVDADPTTGRVSYSWVGPVGVTLGDTDEAGEYAAEWEVTFADGSVQTFPNSTYLNVLVKRDLG